MITRVAHDNYVPLFFALLRLWTAALGESIIALRSFSLVFSAAAMVGVYLFTVEAMAMGREQGAGGREQGAPGADCGRVTNGKGTVGSARWMALLATALFAVSLFQVRSAWEIRMYSVGTALAMFSSWLLVRALSASPARGSPWMLYMAVGLLFAYTHYCALFSLLAQALFALGFILYGVRRDVTAVLKDTRFRWCALSYAGMAAGWSIWLPVFLEQRRRVAGDWYNRLFSGSDVPAMCYEFFFHPQVHGWLQPYAVIVAVLCGFVILAMLWRGRAGEWLVACLAVVPFVLISLVSMLSMNLMLSRYMAFLQPFLLIAIAAMIWRIPIDWLRDIVACLAVSAGLLLHVDFVDSLDIEHRPGARAAAAYIDSQRNAGEPVIGCSPLVMFPTLFHSHAREDWYVYSDRPVVPYYAGGSILRDQEILFDAQIDAIRSKRAWVVTSSGGWARWGLYIPPSWKKTSEERFPEIYAFQNDVKVICYAHFPQIWRSFSPNSAGAASHRP
jgi:hypothetical protein